MDILDDRGRLFGRVNVIDALVVLLALAVVAAGAALVLGGGSAETSGAHADDNRLTQHVTLDLGTHPDSAAALVQSGNATLGGLSEGSVNATITDVYRSPTESGVRLVAVVAVDGERTDEGVRIGGSYLRYGLTPTLSTPNYTIGSRIASVGDGPDMETRTVRATVEANVTTAVADAISVGDSQQVAGDAVATVDAVETVRSSGDRQTVRIDLSLVTRPVGDGYRYGGTPVRIGTALDFETARYELRGRVVAVEP